MENMAHYVCIGTCGGVAQSPGACQTVSCPRHKQELKECRCQDDKHEEVLSKEARGE